MCKISDKRSYMHILSVKNTDGAQNLGNHYHDAHQILYISRGEIAVSVGDRSYTVHEGEILILSRFEEHSIRVLSREYRRYTLLLSSDILMERGGKYLLSSVLVNRSEAFHHVVSTGEERTDFEAIFSLMAREYRDKREMYLEKLEFLLWQLLIMIYRRDPDLFTADVSGSVATVQKIQAAFEANCSEQFSLSALSERYHISSSHLVRSFKRVTGYAPMEYLLVCRFSKAKAYLGTTDKPIREIVELCGFSDDSNFSRMFRARTGMTPTAFRRQYRNQR